MNLASIILTGHYGGDADGRQMDKWTTGISGRLINAPLARVFKNVNGFLVAGNHKWFNLSF